MCNCGFLFNICLCETPAPSYRDHPLQADVERLLLVELELLQGHPCLSDELVVSELVLVADREPTDGRSGCETCFFFW